MSYYYKKSKVDDIVYMQIWNKVNKKSKFVRSCGTASKLNQKLVRLAYLEKQTKIYQEIATKLLSLENASFDQILNEFGKLRLLEAKK